MRRCRTPLPSPRAKMPFICLVGVDPPKTNEGHPAHDAVYGRISCGDQFWSPCRFRKRCPLESPSAANQSMIIACLNDQNYRGWTDRQYQTTGETRRRPPARGETEMVDEAISCAVRRAHGTSTSEPKCWVKMRRSQEAVTHRTRRATTRSGAGRAANGRSARRRR